MSKTRDSFLVSVPNNPELARQLTFLFQRLVDRIDKVEGIRGDPLIEADLDMSGNKITDVGAPVVGSDAARSSDASLPQDLDTTDSPTFAGVTLTDDSTISAGKNIILSTTGTQFGTSTSQKIGFIGVTPSARRSKINDPSGGGTVDTEARSEINNIIDTLEAFGFTAP